MTALILRPLAETDGPAAATVFFQAVQHGTADHYTPEQRAAWAGPAPDPEGWRDRLKGVEGIAATRAGRLVGFMTLDRAGYIDLAFVHPSEAGRGLGRRLYAAIERLARQHATPRLTTQASKRARPFFEALGWQVDAEQTVTRRGTALTNYRMSKTLPNG